MKRHFLAGLGLGAVPSLGVQAVQNIEVNSVIIEQAIEASQQKLYKEGDTLSFDDIDRLHNSALSFEEKQAYVWFKRSQGTPMNGWEKYFIKEEKRAAAASKNLIKLVTNTDTEIRDNHFRPITKVKKGLEIGTPTKYTNTYDKVVYLVFTTPEGYKQYVNKDHVDFIGEQETSNNSSSESIKKLVLKGALFFSSGIYLPLCYFTFGNMYLREEALKKDKDFIIEQFGEEIYENHVKVINDAKPPILSVQNADPRERPIILAISELARNRKLFSISAFREDVDFDLAKEVNRDVRFWNALSWKSNTEKREMRVRWELDAEVPRLSLRDAFRFWLHAQSESAFNEVKAYEIEKYYLDKDRLSSKLSDEEKDTIEKYAPQEGEELFAKFLNEALTYEDTVILDGIFNKTYNGVADINYKKVPIGFTCSAFFKKDALQFSEAQKESIAYMEIVGSGILAYDVGVGKTMSAIITLANALQQGKCKRPCIVVPNQTYRKWIREIFGYTNEKTGEKIHGVLSFTDVTLNDFYNLGANVVSEKNGKLYADGKSLSSYLPENSITMLTYEGFRKLGIDGRNNSGSSTFDELFSILQQSNYTSSRDEAKFQESMREGLAKINKGSIVDFTTIGIDYLVIDEAHACKNIFSAVKADEEGNARYQLSSQTSELGIKAFAICNQLERLHRGNVLLLTATPFTNSPVEIYAMLSLVGYNTMKDMKLANLNNFMCTFVKQGLEYVNKADGSIGMDYVVKQYANRQILQKLIYSHILYKTGEDAGVKRPTKINLPRLKKMDEQGRTMPLAKEEQILTYIRPTLEQRQNQTSIEAQFKSTVAQMGKHKASLGDIGRLLNQNLDNALSPYLVDGDTDIDPDEFVENSPKIEYTMSCIRSVKQWHEERGEAVSGQVIYCNRGKEFFEHIQRYLNSDVGFKEAVKYQGSTLNEVEIITSDISVDKKERIKEAFLDGVVKVIIGTATIREGIDLQRRGTCLYLLTPDWNPTAIKQVEGRIWRQGNLFDYVRVVMPLVQDSMDIFVFQKLEEKTARVNDIWYKAGRGNVLDQEALDPEEIKMALFSKLEILVGLKMDVLTRELTRKITVNEINLQALKTYKVRYEAYVSLRTQLIDFLNTIDTPFVQLIQRLEKSFLPKNGEKIAKENAEKLRDLVEFQDNVSSFVSGVIQEDKELISLLKKYFFLNSKYNFSTNTWEEYKRQNLLDDFRSTVSFLKKTERTLLVPKGYAPEDVNRLIEDTKLEVNAFSLKLNHLATDEGKQEVWQMVKEQKERYAVEGKGAIDRSKEFQKLNYLLQYGGEPKVVKQEQATASEETPNPDRNRRIRIARAKLALYAYAQAS